MKSLQELSLPCHEQAEVPKARSIDVGRSTKIEETLFGFGVSRASNIFSWPASLGNRGNDTGLPLSLKILKRKQSEERESNITINGGRQSACCSIKRAFSSTVFMIRELQTHALQMRQILLCEDLHEVIGMVQREMQTSFVWLFQQVFSSTPIFMVALMILLANFTVYAMGKNVALAAISFAGNPTSAIFSAGEEIKVIQADRSWIKLCDQSVGNVVAPSASSLGDGLGGGGHRNDSIAGDSYGDPPCESTSSLSNPDLPKNGTAQTVETERNGNPSDQNTNYTQQWQRFLKEFESDSKGENLSETYLDHESLKSVVAGTSTHLEPDNYNCYDRTELLYQEAISADPDNVLLLSNYAQFLHLVRHDNHRAEKYFGEALRSDSRDGEAIAKFANFLWLARGDLFSAEKTYLKALGVDPKNPFHAGCYAHFLWNTGGA